MSQGNVELLRAAVEASRAATRENEWNGTLTGGLAELWDPEIEWDMSSHPLPDLAGVYQGREAVLLWWGEWLAAWKTAQIEYELVDAGDRVVSLVDQRMRGRSTGIEVPSGKYAVVFTFRDGLIVRGTFYGRWSEALEAVGPAE